MLEKSKGNIDVTKLRVILLLKANFNTLNKVFYNSRVIFSLEKYSSISHKIIRDYKDYLVVYVVLNKKHFRYN